MEKSKKNYELSFRELSNRFIGEDDATHEHYRDDDLGFFEPDYVFNPDDDDYEFEG